MYIFCEILFFGPPGVPREPSMARCVTQCGPIPTLVPADGLVEASLSEPFATTVQRLHFHSFLTHPEVIHALASVRRECLAVMQGWGVPPAQPLSDI